MGLVGLVHAEVEHGADWERFRRDLFRPSRARELALWGRRRIHAPGDAGVPGISRVFVGHTPVPSPRRFGNVVAIDTGAVYGWRAGSCRRGRLTVVELTVADAILDAPTDPSVGWVDFRMTEPPPLDPFFP
jgi:serine/threonine protein phosphatase 1